MAAAEAPLARAQRAPYSAEVELAAGAGQQKEPVRAALEEEVVLLVGWVFAGGEDVDSGTVAQVAGQEV